MKKRTESEENLNELSKDLDHFNLFQKSSDKELKWREEMSFQDIEVIQDECRGALNIAGYRIFNSSADLKNLSISNFQT